MLAAFSFGSCTVRAKFARQLPGALPAAALSLQDLKTWWKKQPGVAERHRRECPAVTVKTGRTVRVGKHKRAPETRTIPASVVWENVPSPRAILDKYARAHGAAAWARADGYVFCVWYVDGALVRRTGKPA